MNTYGMTNPIQVAVVAFDGISVFHLSVPCLVFHDAFLGEDSPFQLGVTGIGQTQLETAGPLGVSLSGNIQTLETADIIVIPGWPNAEHAAPTTLIDKLRKAYDRGATLVGLCLGACVLAQTGLLDGKRATTHWQATDRFSKKYPNVWFDPHPLYVDEGRLITSAGTAAALDCCLHIVRTRVSSELATRLARNMVTAPYRFGGQKQYIPKPLPESHRTESVINSMMDHILTTLHEPHSLESLAERCAMSRRTFTRHFKAVTGSSFGQWLLHQRLSFSQQLLEQTQENISRVAELAGFGSENAFRQHFKQQFSVSPRQWRTTHSEQTF